MYLLIQLLKSFSRSERLIFFFFLAAFFAASTLAAIGFIDKNTEIVPVAGGEYAEGIVGQPSFINPVLAVAAVDRDLAELIFADLKNLAENYQSEENGKTWRYRLKDGLVWQDGESITSDDIIFTVQIIQNSDAYSPLAQSWQGVDVQRVSEREMIFKLPGAYAFFENILRDFKPIPKHIFGNIPAANIKLSNYNLEPVGSGPYKFSAFKNQPDGYINLYVLKRNDDYSGIRPYLDKINFVFYKNEDDKIKAFNSGTIDGFELADYGKISKINFPHQVFAPQMLKYYAVFFNSFSHQALKDKNVRLALNLAVNRGEIIEKILNGRAAKVFGPLGPLFEKDGDTGLPSNQKEDFSIEKAATVLEETGWFLNEDNVREKKSKEETIKLEFNLTVPEIPFLTETADLIQKNLEKIGVKLNISTRSLFEINNEIIKSRNYQMILFGNILGENPDLFSFWHSSQRFYPGLNLALYENSAADGLIESIRKNLDEEKRRADLISLQSLIVQDLPAIFLYSPDYLYISQKKLKGFEGKFIAFPGDRFENIEKWYIKTARTFR